MKHWFLIAAAASLLTLTHPSRALADSSTAFGQAKATFDEARANKSGKAAEAAAQFAALVEGEPGNPVFAAYRASAIIMQARDAFMPWTKMRHLDDGLADMDRALQLLKPQHEQEVPGGVPVAPLTRLVAANAFLAVPKFANRSAEGRRLVRGLLADENFARAPSGFRVAVLELAISSATEADASARARWQTQLAELQRSHVATEATQR